MAVECCGELLAEHEVVREAADVAMAIAVLLVQGRPVNPDDVDLLIHYARDTVDGRHGRKEEEVLFPALDRAVPDLATGRLARLRSDHEAGAAYVEAAEAHRNDPEALAEALAGWSRLMRAHSAEEDDALFSLADNALDDSTKRSLLEGFHDVDALTTGLEPIGPLIAKYAAVPVG